MTDPSIQRLEPGTSYRITLDTGDGASIEVAGVFKAVEIEDGNTHLIFEPQASDCRVWTSGTAQYPVLFEDWVP